MAGSISGSRKSRAALLSSSGKSMEKHTRSAVDLPELLSPADSFHSLALKSLGAVDRRAAFHSEQFIFPVGYRVSGKLVASSGDATEFVFDIAEHNAEEEAAPMFRIFSKSILKRCVVGNSAETTWRDFIAMISSDAEMALRKIRGVSVLGLDQPAVRIAIEAMDKDRVCTLYWKGRENVLKAVCQAENLFDKVSQRMRDRAMTLSQLIAETGLYNLLPSSKRPTHASNYQDQVEVLRDWISSNNSSGLTGLGKSSFIHEQANRKEVDTGKDISNELSSVVRDGPRTRSSVLPRPPSRLKRKSPSTRSRSQTSDFSIENDQKSNEIGSRNLPDGFFDVGNRVDAKDCNGVWYPATIVSSTGRKVLVNFDGWSDDWNEWISKRLVSGSSARLTTIGTFSSSVKVMRISSPKKNTPLKSSRSKRQRNESWTTTAAPQLENFQKEDPASQIPNTLSNNEPTIVSTVDAQTSQNLSTKISTLLDENSWLTWDEEAVLKWMRLPDVNLGAHCDLFLSKNIAGTMFKYLDDNALKCHVGITSRFERKKILLKLKELMDGSAALPKDAHFQWDIEAVTLYLSSRPYKVDKNEFYEAFKAHGVDGSCLSCLTKEILVEEFGINILFVESLLLKIRLRATLQMSVRHVLKASDLSKAEILRVLSGAKSLKLFPEQFAHVLKQKTLLMLFEKPSLRTRVSFETGMTQLGGHGIFYSTGSGDSTVGKKESIHDTAKTVSRYVDIIMARMKSRKDVQELARYATVPVINALDDFAHPCQVLADLQTIVEVKGGLEGIKFSYVGDVANNMTYDLMRACALLGVEMRVGGPDPEKYGDEYAIEKEVLEECEISGPGKVKVLHNAHEAVQGADIVYTDTWMSYHLSEEKMESRMKTLLPFRVDSDLLNLANPSAVFMHCLPAQRGHEVDANVIDGEKSIVFNQAENRLHAQKSLMLFLLGKLV